MHHLHSSHPTQLFLSWNSLITLAGSCLQVWEGRSDFGNVKRQRIFAELKRKIPGVISVWDSARKKSNLVREVYDGIMHKRQEFNELEFEMYGWIDVPAYWFDLLDISRQLYLDLSSSGRLIDDQTKNIKEKDMEESDIVQNCCELLRKKDCLVVINGLRSIEDWDLFKATFLSGPIKGCMVVITNEGSVAKHCSQDRFFNIIDDLEANSPKVCLLK